MYLEYSDRVQFLTVYIREAHPRDGWRMAWNDVFGIAADQPTSDSERAEIAAQCSESLQLLCPMVVDGIDNRVAEAWSAFPDRLYLVDEKGTVVYQGGRGPFGYHPRELEQAIVMLLMDGSAEP